MGLGSWLQEARAVVGGLEVGGGQGLRVGMKGSGWGFLRSPVGVGVRVGGAKGTR